MRKLIPKKSYGGSILSNAGSMAATGASIGGPWGAGAGALIGGVLGLLQEKAKRNELAKQKQLEDDAIKKEQLLLNRQNDRQIMSNFPTYGVNQSYFAKGGEISKTQEQITDELPFDTFKIAFNSNDFAKKYENNLTFGTAEEGYEKLHLYEQERVNEARKKVLEIAEKATKDQNFRNSILNHKITYVDNPYYCSTRSCELERAAGYTIPKDTTINNRKYTAGSKIPIIPGTQQFASIADTLGYKKVDNPEPGDRIIRSYNRDPNRARHSQIFVKNIPETLEDIVYDDSGDGLSFTKREYFSGYPEEKNDLFYRYVGNKEYYAEQKDKYKKETPMNKLIPKKAKSVKKFGGYISPQYEAEDEEVIQFNPYEAPKVHDTGYLQQHSSTTATIKGKSHKQGGENMSGGDRIFSDKIYFNSKKDADIIKALRKTLKGF